MALHLAKYLGNLALKKVDSAQQVSFLEFDSLHFVVELHLAVELYDLLGLLFEVTHSLFERLQFVFLRVADHALQADVFKTLQAKGLELLGVLRAFLLVLMSLVALARSTRDAALAVLLTRQLSFRFILNA